MGPLIPLHHGYCRDSLHVPPQFQGLQSLDCGAVFRLQDQRRFRFRFRRDEQERTVLEKVSSGQGPSLKHQLEKSLPKAMPLPTMLPTSNSVAIAMLTKLKSSWMNFADSEVLPLSCTIVFPILGIIQ